MLLRRDARQTVSSGQLFRALRAACVRDVEPYSQGGSAHRATLPALPAPVCPRLPPTFWMACLIREARGGDLMRREDREKDSSLSAHRLITEIHLSSQAVKSAVKETGLFERTTPPINNSLSPLHVGITAYLHCTMEQQSIYHIST